MNENSYKAHIEFCDSCTHCSLHKKCAARVFPAFNSLDPDIVIVADMPSSNDYRYNQVWVNTEGEFIFNVMDEVGLDTSKIFITPATICSVPKNDFPKAPDTKNIKLCKTHRLDRELHALNPKLIIAMGTAAIKSLITTEKPTLDHNAGQVFDTQIFGDLTTYSKPVMLTYSAVSMLRFPRQDTWSKFALHLNRAKELLNFEVKNND